MGNEIKFTIGKSEIIIKEGKKVKIKNEDSLDSNVRSIFNAIANSDTNDKVDKTEYNIFEKLKTVFDNLGDWNKDNDVNKEDFNKYCQDVYDANSENENPISDMVKAIELQYNELTKKSPKPENINEDPQPPEPPTQIEESDNIIEEEVANEEVVIITSDEDTSTTQEEDAQKLAQEKQAKQERLNKYNESIQAEVKKIGHGYKPAGQYDKLYTIESGNTLYNIAKQELGGNPTHQEINARVAEIARVNNITNVNVIKVGQKIRLTKLGKQMEIPKAGESSEKSSTEKVTTPTVDFPGEDGTIEGNLKNYTNQFIADALKETSFDISTTNNNDGTKTKNIRLNDDRWIKATYDSSGNITKIEINVDSNSDYSNEALTSDIIVNKDLMQYSTRPQATSLDKSFQEGFKFEEFVAAFEAIESQAEKSAKTEPKKEVTDEKKDGTEQAQVEIHTAKDNKGKEFKASNETILKQFIQEINNPDKDKIEIFEKYSKSHDSELINSMIENDMLKDVVWHSTKPEEMISSILTPENAKNFSQKSLENITNLCQYFKYHDLQKKLNELNPLNKKFSSGELTKDDLENAEKTKLVSTFEHEGIKVYNHNDKFYKVTDNKVEEVPFAEAKAIELSSDLSSRAFDKWYGSDENPNITTDNIVEIVTKFKELNNEGIITALDNKTGGPGVEQMRKLINTLLEKAKNLGLENYDSYKEISKFSTRNMYIGVGGDYAFGRAKQIDKEIDHLIELIELTNKNN